ncbi:MAG: ABC transporter permease [Rhodobacteraceae bacterium]|nr:ABC transporter permease [Paracoccaceae bacterium]
MIQSSGRSRPKFQAVRVLLAMIIREMNTRYGRTWGGYIWAILEPVAMIALLSLAFGQFIHTPPVGDSFVIFYASGYIPFYFYSEIASATSSAVVFNKPLMHFPAVTPLDAVFARFLLSMLTLTVVAVIVYIGIGVLAGWPRGVDLKAVLVSLAAASLLGLGSGTLNCVLFPFSPVWMRIWMVINRPLFLVSGVFFTFESMPNQIQEILWYNPLVHVVGIMRTGIFPSYDADYVSLLFIFGLGLGCFVLGAYLLIRHRSFVTEN